MDDKGVRNHSQKVYLTIVDNRETCVRLRPRVFHDRKEYIIQKNGIAIKSHGMRA